MNLLLSIALGVIAGLTWNVTTHNQALNYWQMGGLYFGATAAADLMLWALEQRRARRRRTHRAVVVRQWNATGRRKLPRP